MNTINIYRDKYGAISGTRDLKGNLPKNLQLAWSIVYQAEKQGLIDPDYDDIAFDRKSRASGTALHYELYDLCRGAALVCLRSTSGSKYGVATTSKRYFILRRSRGKITMMECDNTRVAKLVKRLPNYGDTIRFFEATK